MNVAINVAHQLYADRVKLSGGSRELALSISFRLLGIKASKIIWWIFVDLKRIYIFYLSEGNKKSQYLGLFSLKARLVFDTLDILALFVKLLFGLLLISRSAEGYGASF